MPTRWLKLTVAYDGTAYAGWQLQPSVPTVQAAIETAWHEITREQLRVMAAGRTDAGVHALGQVVGLVTESQLTTADLHRGLNAVLPDDVAVVAIEVAPENFHATHDARRKTYRYQIHNGRTPDVFHRRFVWHYPQPLDAEKMHAAAQALLGKHDFSSFESAGSERPDSIRTLFELTVKRGWLGSSDSEPPVAASGGSAQPRPQPPKHPVVHPDRITIEVTGDGFLYNMVRAIVGTLVEVGKGSRDVAWPGEVLAARNRSRAGQTARPAGRWPGHSGRSGAGYRPGFWPSRRQRLRHREFRRRSRPKRRHPARSLKRIQGQCPPRPGRLVRARPEEDRRPGSRQERLGRPGAESK
jgi:tRNA pseudouridine38-40 synthase